MSNHGERTMYGLVAEFHDEEQLKHAAEQVRAAGYKNVRAFTPFRVEGLHEILGQHSSLLPWLVLLAMGAGVLAGYAMQYYTDVISYPMNVGGRPLNSWPSFVIICFELAILFGGLTALGGMLAFNGLPLPYHPIFNTPNFELATGNRFYLCIEATDRRFHLQRTRQFLESTGANAVNEARG
jgi:hypothetical protein